MSSIPKPVRIAPAFDDPGFVWEMFARHAPYRTNAYYLPIRTGSSGLPWFRGKWAEGGVPLVAGAERILHNPRFINAACNLFSTSKVRPSLIVVNVNGPMPAGPTHVDVPDFYGATRELYPHGFLVAMGKSGLFEDWRVIRAGAVSWFYDGPGGDFEYWPEGLDGPIFIERAPFRNVAIMADNDRMYHRIGWIGEPNAELPRMTDAAEIRPAGDDAWVIVENRETRASYPAEAVRLSLVWKADVDTEGHIEPLTLDRVMTIFLDDLRQRSIDFPIPADPLSDSEWMALLDRIYCVRPSVETARKPMPD